MDEAKDGSEVGGEGERPQPDARAEREARLARALRDNLRRRKAPGRKGPGRKRAEPPPGSSGRG